MHMSGSWILETMIKTLDFEWKVVPIPCGPGGCGAMRRNGIVAFKSTQIQKLQIFY